MKHHSPSPTARQDALPRLALALLLSHSLLVGAVCAQQMPASEKPAQANDAEQEASAAPRAGEQTKAWLGGQARREQSSKIRPSLSGPVMSRVSERYLNSFSTRAEPTNFHDRSSIAGN
jgi:hypothetical protein